MDDSRVVIHGEDLPAILGGRSLFPQGPPDWPGPDPLVREGLLAAWADGSWGRYDGGLVNRLESNLASFLGRQHALAVGSGTLGLELALRAVGVSKGDGVVLCDYDYPGNFLTIHALGAMPILVDVDPSTGQISFDALERTLESDGLAPIKAIVISPIHGNLPDLGRIEALANEQKIPLIEDACQVPGARWNHRPCGSFGTISIWSFGGSKLLSAGRGGMVFTDDPTLHQRMKLSNTRGSIVGPLSELQAAAVLAQWKVFEERHARRAAGALALRNLLAHVPGIQLPQWNYPVQDQAYYKWDFFWEESSGGLTRDQLVQSLKAEGLAVEVGFRSLHAGRSRSRFQSVGDLKNSEASTPRRVVIHHPVLLHPDGPGVIAKAILRIKSHTKEIAQKL